jgi:undecaprenyl-diphosphatase
VLRALDLRLLRLLRTRGHPAPVEVAVIGLARTGEHGLVWYALSAAGALADPGRRPLYLRAMRAVAAAYLANTAIKAVVRRDRPALQGLPALVPTISDRSYPSAHAATSFAGARLLSGPLPRVPLYLLATSLALSRPYLGVHYPSDAIAGAMLGDAIARLVP